MKTEKGDYVPLVGTFSYLWLIILFAEIVVSIFVEPTKSQQHVNVVVKLFEKLLG